MALEPHQPMLTFMLRHLLNGISQSSPGHLQTMFPEKITKSVYVTLAHLAQHPADSLVHQVVMMAKKGFRQPQCVVKLTRLYQPQGRNDRYALLPQIFTAGKPVKHRAISIGMQQPVADYLRTGQIHQVPVIGLTGMAQIESSYLLTPFIRILLLSGKRFQHLLHKNHKTTQTHFMPPAVQQFFKFGKRHAAHDGLDHFTRLRHFQPEKFITFAIFAFACLEKAHQIATLNIVTLFLESSRYLFGCIIYGHIHNYGLDNGAHKFTYFLSNIDIEKMPGTRIESGAFSHNALSQSESVNLKDDNGGSSPESVRVSDDECLHAVSAFFKFVRVLGLFGQQLGFLGVKRN